MKDYYKTTTRHYEIFQKEAVKWIKRFGLFDWSIKFFHEAWDENCRARIRYNRATRVASINLETSWNTPIVIHELKKAAFHEVMELLIAELCLIASSRSYDEGDLEQESHTVIRRLEYGVFDYERSK